MKKLNLSLAAIFFVGGLFFAQNVLAQEKINRYQVDARLQVDGNLYVSENIFYDFGSEGKHGIYRQIPVKYKGEKEDFVLHIDNIRVVDQEDKAYDYEVYKKGDYLVIKIGNANKYVSGQKIYIINYQLHGALLFFDDYDEFYWNAVGDKWSVPIVEAEFNLALPQAVSQEDSVFKCWSGLYGSKDTCQNLTTNNTDQGVDALQASQQNILPEQALTILVQTPKGIFDEAQATQIAKDWTEQDKQDMWGNWWFLLLPLLVFSLMYYWWRKYGKDPKGRGNIIVEYDVPHDLRPSEAGAIVYENFENKYLTAEIIYLATHGYIKISRQPKTGIFGKDDFTLMKIKEADQNLKNYQQDLLKFLFADKVQQVKLSDLKDDFYTHLYKWKNEVWTLLKNEEYYSHPAQHSKVFLLVLGIIFVAASFGSFVLLGIFGMIAIVLSGLIIIFFSRFMPQKTKGGVLTKEYLLGLKEYLEVAEKERLKFHNAPDKDPVHFEKLLPFAIVFSVEKEWAEKFKDIYKVQPNWYSDPTLSNFNALLFVNSLHNFETVSIKNLSTPTHSGAGGFGGGGGFSGGGFGGGGGGSW